MTHGKGTKASKFYPVTALKGCTDFLEDCSYETFQITVIQRGILRC
jgi:hypothetical protein